MVKLNTWEFEVVWWWGGGGGGMGGGAEQQKGVFMKKGWGAESNSPSWG